MASSVCTRLGLAGLILLLSLSNVNSLRAQIGLSSTGSTRPIDDPTLSAKHADAYTTLEVNIYDLVGQVPGCTASVHIYSDLRNIDAEQRIRDGATGKFQNILPGEYTLQINCSGYKPAQEMVYIPQGRKSMPAYVYLQPESSPFGGAGWVPPLVRGKAHKEMIRGLNALHEDHLSEAQSHVQAALRIAPGSPDLHYVLGMVYMKRENMPMAKAELETAISDYPSFAAAFVALGELQLRQKKFTEAISSLERALTINEKASRAHWLAAQAYFHTLNYEKAREHSERTIELGGESAGGAQLLLGRALLELGDREAARAALDTFLRQHKDDKAATSVAKEYISELEQPRGATTASVPSAKADALSAVPADVPVVERPWAPPEIDSAVPGVLPDVSCSLPDVLHQTSDRMKLILVDLERFTATEHIEHQEIARDGTPGDTRERVFYYNAAVVRAANGLVFLEETRSSKGSKSDFPTSLVTTGLAAIPALIFHPAFIDDYEFTCEGLGQWQGHPAWQVRFEQRPDKPNYLREWRTSNGRAYRLELRGRVWIAANSFQVQHLETDLAKPVPDIYLAREHLLIDYGPVPFKNALELWLPLRAEMFMDYRGHHFRHVHQFGDYRLFSVETKEKIGTTKNPNP